MTAMQVTISRAVLVIVLLSIMGVASAQEPIYLGGGAPGQAINLDAGAKVPGYRPAMGHHGFAAPPVPQTRVLDPGSMVHQAEMYRDQARAACAEALDLQLQSQQSAQSAQNSSRSAELLAASARKSAEAASSCLDSVLAAQEESARQLEQIMLAVSEARLLLNLTASRYQADQDVRNQTRTLRDQTMVMRDQTADLYRLASQLLDDAASQPSLGDELPDILNRLDRLERMINHLEERPGQSGSTGTVTSDYSD